jgi:hypothetical protein
MKSFTIQRDKDEVLGDLDTRIDVVCSDCGKIVMEKLPNARTAYMGTPELAQHVCPTMAQSPSTM